MSANAPDSSAPPLPASLPPSTRRERLAWCTFDFANSSFTTVIVTVVYAVYFVKAVVGEGETGPFGWSGDAWWNIAGAISQALVLLSAPLLGAIADRKAAKKSLLAGTWLLCVLATAALSLLGDSSVLWALFVFIIANIAFSTGENLVAGFLPELVPPERMGRLSALGWTIGYFGGLAALGLSIGMVSADQTRWVPLAIAGFFFLTGLPTFLFLRERARPKPGRSKLLREGFGELLRTWRARENFRATFRFLASIVFFQAGVAVVIANAAIYADLVIGMSEEAVILLFVLLQFSAAGGAFLFGQIQDRCGSRPALAGSLVLWMVAVFCAWSSRPPEEQAPLLALHFGSSGAEPGLSFRLTLFHVAGILSGAAMGASQSASRALMGLFCPPGREGEWFGLWGFATKLAAVFGLVFYAALRASDVEMRQAILATLVLFVVGLILLARVDVERGRREALAAA